MNADFKSPETVTSDKLAKIHQIWRELAGSRIAPARADIAPARLRALLPWTWLVDVIGNGEDFRFRIAGERVVEYLGARHSGKRLSELRGPKFFELMHGLFSYAVKHKRPVLHGPLKSALAGRDHYEAEVLILPLSDDGERVTALFGGFDVWPYGTHFK